MDIETEIANFKSALVKLEETFKREVEKAYQRGWNAGVATKPDHAAFHKAHQEPADYGEDGEIVVISGKLKFDDATEKISKHLLEVCGMDEEYANLEAVRENTDQEMIAMAEPGSEYSYIANRGDTGGVFNAWVWRA